MERTEETAFGSVLRRFRLDAELTQEELAERAGLSVRGVGDLERGVSRAPFRGTVHQLADALALSPADRDRLFNASRRHSSTFSLREPGVIGVPPTPLIGRERELRDLRTFLEEPSRRLLTVTGPGGVGKTRLALEVASEFQDHPTDGVYVISLAALREPMFVPSAVAQALGVRETPGRPVTESLVTVLREKNILLFLDNLEHLLPAAGIIAGILYACPELRVLATSRAALRVHGEQEYPIQPLLAPDPRYAPPAHALSRYSAVKLFVDRVRACQPDFRLSDANAVTVAEICYRLDGLPLALELAAARVKLFPLPALLQRLDRRLQVLTGGPLHLPVRLQTMRNAIDWSYSLLSDEEQVLFSRLSVFVGGCTFEAAQAVCNPDGALELLEGLASLVDKSLVRQQGKAEPRCSMLETIRQYASEQLEARGEAEKVGAGHARHFLRLAEEADLGLRGPQAGNWHLLLELELGNLRAALTWFLERGQIEEELRLALGLYEFWRARAYWSEGQHWLLAGLARSEGVEGRTRARALSLAGVLLTSRGELAEGTAMLERALCIARQIGDTQRIAVVLRYLGLMMHRRGETADAVRQIEEGLELFRAVGDARGVAVSLNTLGTIAAECGDFVRAEIHHREAVALYREQEDVGRIALSLNHLGTALLEQGRLAEARTCLEEGLALTRQLEFKADLPYLLHSLGRAAYAQGELKQAHALFAESLSLNREAGDTWINLSLLGRMAELAVKQGKAIRAARLAGAEQSARDAASIPSPPVDRERRELAMSQAREILGGEAFAQAWEEGGAMTLDEAIAYALTASR